MKMIEFFIPRKLSLTALGIQSQSAVSRKVCRMRSTIKCNRNIITPIGGPNYENPPCLIFSLIIGLALLVGAANWEGDRPERVRAENWIRMSDAAGIAINRMSSDKIAGVLYVKRDEKWIQVSIENPQGVVEYIDQ